MRKKRKIAMVVRKLSFAEAEEADDKYWSEQSPEYRLKTLMNLRETVFGNVKNKSIKKAVFKRTFNEEGTADVHKLKSRNKNK